MMAQTVSNRVCVIGSEFVSPCPIDIIVDSNPSGKFVARDDDDNILLKVRPRNTTFHQQLLLLNADDRPVLMLRDKMLSTHTRWNAFLGKCKANSKLVFSTKTPNVIQFKKSLHVFLAYKTSSEDVCDFKIKGSCSKKDCTIFMGNSSTIIAKMHEVQESKKAKGRFKVTIYQNVDYAFVIALIATVHAMESTDDEYAEQVA